MTLPRWSRPATGVVSAALVAGLAVTGTPAHASPIGDARARAAQLRHQVDLLQQQAEIATEDYDAAYEELGQAVTAHLLAKRRVDAAREASGGADDAAERRVRALYMSGGVPALYAKVLDSGSISEVALRVHQVKVVLDGDQHAAAAADRAVLDQRRGEQELAAAAAKATRLQAAVAARADKVRALLAQTDSLLAAADQRVRDLAEQQRRAAEAAAAARAAAALASGAYTGPYNGPDLPKVDASPLAAAALAFARTRLGKPYVWGATGPDAFDCSGLTGAAYRAAGLSLPRTSRQQWFSGPHVALADLQPGDLLFWASDTSNPSTIHHVALYAGNDLMVAAPHSGDVVRVQPVYLDGYIGAVRPGGKLSKV
jgi:cell wall-associated NlpC family hydrolase